MGSVYDRAAQLLTDGWNGILPVDLRRIGDQLAVEIKGQDIADCARIETGSAGNLCIVFNRQEIPNRRRFAVAHAIGHIALGHETVPFEQASFFSLNIPDLRERAANEFALALLMPEQTVRSLVEGGRFKNVQQLAAVFSVSPVAMGYRMAELYR